MRLDEGLGAPAKASELPPALTVSEHAPSADRVLALAQEYLFSVQSPDAHWCAELESNVTIISEYVFLAQALGFERFFGDPTRRENTVRYICSRQKPDGGWGIAASLDGDVSTSAEAYLALRILGLPVEDPRLRRAEAYIRGRGGLEQVRVFTRIHLAWFGLVPWDAVPSIPPEFILMPPQSPVNIYALSSWARGTIVPLFVIAHHQPVFALPNGKSARNSWLDHLWLDPATKHVPYVPPLPETIIRHGISWRSFFTVADGALKFSEKALLRYVPKTLPRPLRSLALRRCEEWILEHQEESGDWAGIFPPMVNGVLALTLQGYALDSAPVKKGLEALERFCIDDHEGFRIQACESPVWDTVLAMIGAIDGGQPGDDPRLKAAADWVRARQLLVEHGDWKVYNPNGTAGGWSFEYENSWYPDVDDTAAVVLALLKQDPASSSSETVLRAIEWMLSMQNRDGGWAAFDLNNDRAFLNHIPFSDMESLCDPSSPDVTGRVIESFGLLLSVTGGKLPVGLRSRLDISCRRAVEYLRFAQEMEGSWFGRWGVNYIYGTSNVLCGLAAIRFSPADPMVERALEWMASVQNADGGFGESLKSYSDRRWMGRGESSASQSAWGLMGYLAYLPASHEGVQRSAQWLLERQRLLVDRNGVPDPEILRAVARGMSTEGVRGGTWEESAFTGTGFPNHFYLRYHLYSHYFPMMALGRYATRARLPVVGT